MAGATEDHHTDGLHRHDSRLTSSGSPTGSQHGVERRTGSIFARQKTTRSCWKMIRQNARIIFNLEDTLLF
jgi:hypothetical protein